MLYVDVEKKIGSYNFSYNASFVDSSVSIMGPSGSGKSTLLKIIAGLITPDRGRIMLNDRTLFDSQKKINIKPQERRVGYSFQNYALFPNMNVEKNIKTGLLRIKDKKRRDEIFLETIETLKLEKILKSMPHSISGGEAQRVALARIIVNKPDIFLFDEVFSSLDYELSKEVQEYLKKLIEKLCIQSIFVTHNPEEARYMTRKIYTIRDGKLIC